MKSNTSNPIIRTIKEYAIILFGLLLYAFAWIALIKPAGIVGGGVGGMGLLIYYATGGEDGGIPMAYSMLMINAVLITIASFIIGFKFSAKTIFAVLLVSFIIQFLDRTLPPNLLGLADDQLLSGILAGVFGGLGISICFSQGGSTGGTDIIAMIINKYRAVSYGRVIMACDMIIIGLSYFTGNGISTVIYSVVVVGVMGYTLDMALNGSKQSSQIIILSKKYEDIASQISEGIHRGVTMLDAVGWYTKESTKMLVVVCRKSETNVLLRIIKEVDGEAFITVSSVLGAYGKGFDDLTAKIKRKSSSAAQKKQIQQPEQTQK